MTGFKLKINLIYHKNIYLSICLVIACNIINLPIINQFHIALHHACHHHIQHGLTDAFHEQYILSRSDGDHEASNKYCPFCLQLHALYRTIIIKAVQNFSLVRQAKLGASCRVKVPVGQGLANHPYRVLRDWEG